MCVYGRRSDPGRITRRGRLASPVLVSIALISIAGAATPGPLPGQEPSSVAERSPMVAALVQAALPPLPLGYIYAEDLGRAVLPTSLMVGGGVAFILGAVELVDWTDEDRSPALFYGGLGATWRGTSTASSIPRMRCETGTTVSGGAPPASTYDLRREASASVFR